MIYVLIGNDIFSKKQFIKDQSVKSKSRIIYLSSDGNLSDALRDSQGDMFGGQSIVVVEDGLSFLLTPDAEHLKLAGAAQEKIFCIVNNLDKRKKEHTAIIKNPALTVAEFIIPEGGKLLEWVIAKSLEMGVIFEKKVPEFFIKTITGLGPNDSKKFGQESYYDLYMLNSELQKIANFSNGQKVTLETIKKISTEQSTSDTFEILSFIGDKKNQKASFLIEQFFSKSSEDDKGKVIKLSAILSEQLRGLLFMQSAMANKISDEQICSQSGWKQGRVYITKQLAGKFNREQIQNCLSKLEHLDLEMKTTNTPPRILLDMVLVVLK